MVAAGQAERPAIRSPAGVLTYRDLLAQVNRIAHVLRDDLGLVPGNRVLLRGAEQSDDGGVLARGREGRLHRRGDHAAAAREGAEADHRQGAGQRRAVRHQSARRNGGRARAVPRSRTHAVLQYDRFRCARYPRCGQAHRVRSASTRPPTTSASSPSPPAPPACPRARCISTAT